ncbi:MAG TPA: hypothetical protein VNZ22_13895, partial [Bacillota bacterium]|nr:hypothetical protein [Bacillota bacterium]
PAEVWWFMHTPASVNVAPDGRSATLTIGTAQLQAQLLAPKEAKFSVLDPEPLPTSPHPERQAKNSGIKKLAIHLTGVTDAKINVFLTPINQATTQPPPALLPLAEW